MERKKQPAKANRKGHGKKRDTSGERPFAWYYPPTFAELRARCKPTITKGPFSLVWVNPKEPVVIPEPDDDDDPEFVLED